MTPVLALNGILFEPFSGTLAAWFAGLLGVMLSDSGLAPGAVESKPEHPLVAIKQSDSSAE